MAGEWTSCRLADCLTAEFPGEWGTEAKCDGTGATVLRATDIDDDGHVDLLGGSVRNIAPKKIAEKRLQIGDILLEASGGGPGKPVGRVALFDPQGDGIYLSSNFFRTLRPNSKVEPRFLAYALQRLHLLPVIWRFQQQTTGIINLKVQEYLEHLVEVPNRLEQRRIAEILDTVDEAIRRTEQVIEKLQQMKQGLLSDLLTRGIDDNGELRPPSEEAPHMYKDSPLGLIPRDWDVHLLDDISQRGSGHTPNKGVATYWNGCIKWVSLADSSKLDHIYIYETDKKISESGIANSSAVKHPAGTVILSRDAGVGKSAILASEMAVSQHFIAWRCGPTLNNVFFYYYLQNAKRQFEGIAFGSTIKTIGLGYFKALQIALPPIVEQEIACKTLFELEARLSAEHVQSDKFKAVKKGLMDDLLTGRVRVTVPEGEC